jgi:hypothetical protein
MGSGFGVGVASDQLKAQPHSHSNSEKKTSHNIEQHLYGFDIESDRTRDPKESQYSICDVNVFTVPTRFSEAYKIPLKLKGHLKDSINTEEKSVAPLFS